ncbi:MAG: geranylgeranyl reductase family protein [Bacteroidales bacterium]|nr:geranylgeranyl reductase family protein [Bacteroidales bacterium]
MTPVQSFPKTDAEVIIIGAGPAGTIAAFELAKQGISVLILEKAIFPRYKVCGAGLTHKILCEIPFDLSPVFETTINTICFSTGLKEVFTRTSPDPIIYCSMREKLDAFLLSQAVAAGARVIHGVHAQDVKQSINQVEVITRTGSYRSKLLIGADGASSMVARVSGLRDNLLPGLAWEAEIKTNSDAINRFSNTVFLDWGSFPGGYGWVFPKKDHFSVGVGGPAHLSKWMMLYYQQFMNYFMDGLQNFSSSIPHYETSSLKSWPIPVRVKKSRFINDKVVVVGDAGGLTDPLTGEGIYYAIRSGKLAAEACSDYLQGKSSKMDQYSLSVNEALMTELLEANRIRYLFNTVPGKIHHFVRDSDRAWRAFGKVLRGERWYADVRRGFGKWRILWGTACRISKQISDRKERKFLRNGKIRTITSS